MIVPALLLAASPASADSACLASLRDSAPALTERGFDVRQEDAVLVAVHRDYAGRIEIAFRCSGGERKARITNYGLPDIPLKVLLAAGPDAELVRSTPDYLRPQQQ